MVRISMRPLKVLFLTFDLADNSTGRTYALWLLAEHLGWMSTIVGAAGDEIWPPLAGSLFAEQCVTLADSGRDYEKLKDLARGVDLIVAVKAVPGSFDRALRLHQDTGCPVLLDIDDPDLEGRMSFGHLPKMVAKMILRPRKFRVLATLRRRALAHRDVTVSNPVLQARYKGTIVPHARADVGEGASHQSASPRIVFVGTVRAHKGVNDLRRAVSELQHLGYTLAVTDDAPIDAHPWEEWTGRTSLEEGQRLVREGDVVVIASRSTVLSRAQLPAKLIDAMLAGRGIVVSDLEPLMWATGGNAVTFRAGDYRDLKRALIEIADPTLRTTLGDRARALALEKYSLTPVAEKFDAACRASID